ncbi:unnamed protein product [Closterium sp. NIES-64]|nr:unnamed protein product [Closterium sp. NIES-64]
MPRAYPGRYAEAVVEGSTSSWPWQRWRDVAGIQAPQIPHQHALDPPFDPAHPLARLPTIRPTFLSPSFLHASSSSPYPPRTTGAISPSLPPQITARGAAWGAAAGAAAAGVTSEAALVLVSLALLLSLWNRQLRRSTSGSCQQYSLDEVSRATDYFAEENKIGTGGFAHVYRGTSPFNPDSLWAVKRCTVPTEHFGRVVREMSNKIHPNLVRLIGCCNDFNEAEGRHEQIVICELMPGGSIHGRFSRDHITPCASSAFSPRCNLSSQPPSLPPFLLSSFAFLSSSLGIAKISAFGAVRMGYDEHMVQSMGTHGYIDPASRANRNARPSADVYSFGVVMLEMLTGRKAVEWDGNADSNFKGWVSTHPLEGALKERVGMLLERLTTGSGRCTHHVAMITCISPLLLSPRPTFPPAVCSPTYQVVQCLYDRNVALIGDPHLKAPDSVVVRMADLALPCLAMPPDSRPSMARVIHDLEAVKLFIASQWPDLVHCSPDAARSADGTSGELSSGEAVSDVAAAERRGPLLCQQVSVAEVVRATGGWAAERRIGSGGFGDVYRGINEMASKHHPNLVRLLGFCIDGDTASENMEQIAIYEFMPNGDLEKRLHPEWCCIPPSSYLSHFSPQPTPTPTPPLLMPPWHVVVVSFGIVMLELLTGHRVVFILDGGAPMNIKEWVEQRIASGEISAIGDPFMRAPDSLVLRMARLALRCTAALTAARPTMGEAATELETLKKEFFGLESGRMAQRVDEQMQSLRLTHRDLREELQMIAGIESSASSATGRRLSGGVRREEAETVAALLIVRAPPARPPRAHRASMPPPAPLAGASAPPSARACTSALRPSCTRWYPRSHAQPFPTGSRSTRAADSSAQLARHRCAPLRVLVGRERASAGHGAGRSLAGGESAVWGRPSGKCGGRVGELVRCQATGGDAVSKGGGGRGGGGAGGAGSGGYRSLEELANSVEACFFEVCVSNSGRPAAMALHDLVAAAADAFLAGHSLQRLLLQLQYGGAEGEEFRMSEAGYRLTSSEQHYRTQWIKTVYLTMYRLHLQQPGASFIHMPASQQRHGTPSGNSSSSSSSSGGSSVMDVSHAVPGLGMFEGAMPPASEQPVSDASGSSNGIGGDGSSEESRSGSSSSSSSMGALEGLWEVVQEEPWLGSIVDRVLEGQRTGEEQSLVHFDRALATAGASGGVAAERRVIAPQWLPISQLVLLTCKVANERRGPEQGSMEGMGARRAWGHGGHGGMEGMGAWRAWGHGGHGGMEGMGAWEHGATLPNTLWGGTTRCAVHLAKWKGQDGRPIRLCKDVSPKVREEVRAMYENKEENKSMKRGAAAAALDSVLGAVTACAEKKGKITEFFGDEATCAKEDADNALCLMISVLKLPERIVDDPVFRYAVQCFARAGLGYVPPKRGYVGGAGLKKVRQKMEAALAPVAASWKRDGVTVSSDMMTDRCGRPQANILLVNDSGAVFEQAVDCNMESKTGGYIASLLRPVIDKVGPENVVAVCTDGGSNYASAARKIAGTWPHIEHVPCATHVLDLLMEDVGKMGWAKGLVEKGGEMITFVRNHHFTRAYMKKVGGKQVLKPAGTRFGTQYIAMARLCEVRSGLAAMVLSDEWKVWAAGDKDRKTAAEKFRAVVMDEEWWGVAEFFSSLMAVPFKAMRATDSSAKGIMGKLYDIMLQLTEDINDKLDASGDFLTRTERAEITKIVKDRWDNSLACPMHVVGRILNPANQEEGIFRNDVECTRVFKDYIERHYDHDGASTVVPGNIPDAPIPRGYNMDEEEEDDLLGGEGDDAVLADEYGEGVVVEKPRKEIGCGEAR